MGAALANPLLVILPQLRGKILILTVCAAGIGGTFQYGYNLTIINAPTAFIQSFINETWLDRTGAALEGKMITLVWSFIVAVYPLGGLAGALIAAPMAVKMGRKKSLLLNNAFVALASLLVGFSRVAKSFEMILLSRFFAGINSGVAMSIQPMYLGESAPKELRGAVAMTSASFAALGLVIGQVAGLREILGAEESWPVLLASNAVPGLVQLVLLPWAPESPRYLLIDRGDQDSCISALRQLRGSSDLSIEMKEILAEQAALQGQAAKAPWELWSNRAVRWQLITVVVLSSAMQLCGNDSMYFYASYVFQEAGIPYDKIQYSVIGTGSCELIMSMTCNLLIECVGRRMLLIGGYSLMATWAILFMVVLSLQEQFSWMPYLSMACIFAYILSFGIGPAGVTGIIPTEIFDQVARPAAYTISGSLLWINLFLVGLAFPFVVESLGYYCYLPFFIVCVGTTLYVWFFLPETKGKSFLEISEEFVKRNFGGQPCDNAWVCPEEIISTML
ncbi:solute carrier family 2, facilitated glucose transporter member 11 [Protobothrops mucrosquamatus]|uniref:solute carrier family 2, facilitated glucose transporter member 11 n=1 Tax=Protobothrops mucrosquamatus TaxID=103944 RepID=UPI000775F250|nr:solute carrier family 2, facilitated glucose transporter member 11 [Protobothrops mucrosquamatus]